MIHQRSILSGVSAPYVIYALVAILGLALVLRIWGITFALPYDFTPDEIHEIVRALKLGAGEYSWNAGKGGLYLLLFVEYGFLYVAWWLTGRVGSPTDFALLYLEDPTAFYLAGRLTVALMGATTCLVTFLIGKRIYNWRVGLGAAFIGATAYYHSAWSHYINVDVGMTLALWASILCYLQYEAQRQLRWLIGAAMLGGVAIVFKLPGAIVLVPLLLAICTPLEKWSAPRRLLKEAGIVLLVVPLTAVLMAPELALALGSLPNHFSSLLGAADISTDELLPNVDLDTSQAEVTIMRGSTYTGLLFNQTNIILTIAAVLGGAIGLWRRNRWDILWCVLIAVFLVVMSSADRPASERYMMPIVPALWLLGACGAAAIAQARPRLMALMVAAIGILPLLTIIYQDYMWTRPDTRVLSKEWIEENIPSGSKILMDGMQYRFIHSPPLNPNEIAVARRVGRAENEGEHLSRGVSQDILQLYVQGMERLTGPTYDLHSTVWGLVVEDLSYYPSACFDYIILSSEISERYNSPEDELDFPKSVNFYRALPTDPRYRKIFSAEPVPWKIQGPTITVYAVSSSCN